MLSERNGPRKLTLASSRPGNGVHSAGWKFGIRVISPQIGRTLPSTTISVSSCRRISGCTFSSFDTTAICWSRHRSVSSGWNTLSKQAGPRPCATATSCCR